MVNVRHKLIVALRARLALSRASVAQRAILTSAMTTAFAFQASEAQPVVALPARGASCAICRLNISVVATLGSVDEPHVKQLPSMMARDSRGNFYVTWISPPVLVSVFDSTGRFVKELGRKGSGPGEYNAPVSVVVDRNDRILVWDFLNASESVFDSQHRFLYRTHQPAATLYALPDGRRAANFSVAQSGSSPVPVTIFDSLSRSLAAFGSTRFRPMDANPWRAMRTIGPGHGFTLWSARHDVYRLEQWDPSGRLLREVVRTPEWFSPIAQRARLGFGERPTPAVRGIREDDDGLLWFVVGVAATNWTSGLGASAVEPGRPPVYAERELDRGRLYDTVIDVFDTRRNTLLVSERVAGNVLFALPDGLFARYRQDEEGHPFIDILRITVLGHTRGF